MKQADDEVSRVDTKQEGCESESNFQNTIVARCSSVKVEEKQEERPWLFTETMDSASPSPLAYVSNPVTLAQNAIAIARFQQGGQNLEIFQNYVDENEVEIGNGDITEVKSRRRSEAWKYFTDERKPDGSLWARCKRCNLLLSAKSSSGTSHLNRHLKQHCSMKSHKDVKQMFGSFSSRRSFNDTEDFKFNQDSSRRNLAKLVICAKLPFSTVELPEFVNFVKSLQPSFQFVDRNTVRNDCIAMYDEEKKRILNMFKNLKSRVSFSCDLQRPDQMHGYLALTAHFINDDFVLMKKMLNFKRITCPHSSYVTNDEIHKYIGEWGLEEKLFAFTYSNCTTDDNLVASFNENWCNRLGIGDHLQIRSCSHILNIMIQDGIKVLDAALENIRNIIIHATSTPSRMHDFNEIAKQCGLVSRMSFILDISTNWNAAYDMLQSVLLYKEAFVKYAQLHYHGTDAPTDDDWKKVGGILEIVKAFTDATNVLTETRYPSANLYFKEVWFVQDLLKNETDEAVRDFILEMQTKFRNYWNECSMILAIACILDPRFKCLFVQYCYEKTFGEDEAKQNVEQIRDCLYKLYTDYEKAHNAEKNVASDGSSEQELNGFSGGSSTLEYTGKRKLEMDFATFWSQNALKKGKRNELDAYLSEDIIPTVADETFSILSWWKYNAAVYPVLSRMALDVLAIPVSTVASESATSSGLRWIAEVGSSLDSSKVEALICAQDWFHDNYYAGVSTDLQSSNTADELFESSLAE